LAKATEALAVEKLSWRVRCAALDEILRSLRRRTDRQRCATVRGAGRSPLVRSFAPADTSDRALRGGSDRTAWAGPPPWRRNGAPWGRSPSSPLHDPLR